MFGKQTPGHAAEVRRWMGAAKRGLVTKAGKSAAKDTGRVKQPRIYAAGRYPSPWDKRIGGEEKMFPEGG